MRVVTLNTWQKRGPWRERWNVLHHDLANCMPSVVCLQELFDKDLADEVTEVHEFPERVFPGDSSGLALFSNYPIKNHKTHKLKIQSPTEDYFRYLLCAEVDWNGRSLFVFNTHLSWKPQEGSVREKQVEEILRIMQETAQNESQMIMGDFNASPDTDEIYKMTQVGGFSDAYAKMLPGDSGLTWDNGRNPYACHSDPKLPSRRIDYLFLKGEMLLSRLKKMRLVFSDFNQDGVCASDHFGLLGVFADEA